MADDQIPGIPQISLPQVGNPIDALMAQYYGPSASQNQTTAQTAAPQSIAPAASAAMSTNPAVQGLYSTIDKNTNQPDFAELLHNLTAQTRRTPDDWASAYKRDVLGYKDNEKWYEKLRHYLVEGARGLSEQGAYQTPDQLAHEEGNKQYQLMVDAAAKAFQTAGGYQSNQLWHGINSAASVQRADNGTVLANARSTLLRAQALTTELSRRGKLDLLDAQTKKLIGDVALAGSRRNLTDAETDETLAKTDILNQRLKDLEIFHGITNPIQGMIAEQNNLILPGTTKNAEETVKASKFPSADLAMLGLAGTGGVPASTPLGAAGATPTQGAAQAPPQSQPTPQPGIPTAPANALPPPPSGSRQEIVDVPASTDHPYTHILDTVKGPKSTKIDERLHYDPAKVGWDNTTVAERQYHSGMITHFGDRGDLSKLHDKALITQIDAGRTAINSMNSEVANLASAYAKGQQGQYKGLIKGNNAMKALRKAFPDAGLTGSETISNFLEPTSLMQHMRNLMGARVPERIWGHFNDTVGIQGWNDPDYALRTMLALKVLTEHNTAVQARAANPNDLDVPQMQKLKTMLDNYVTLTKAGKRAQIPSIAGVYDKKEQQ